MMYKKLHILKRTKWIQMEHHQTTMKHTLQTWHQSGHLQPWRLLACQVIGLRTGMVATTATAITSAGNNNNNNNYYYYYYYSYCYCYCYCYCYYYYNSIQEGKLKITELLKELMQSDNPLSQKCFAERDGDTFNQTLSTKILQYETQHDISELVRRVSTYSKGLMIVSNA